MPRTRSRIAKGRPITSKNVHKSPNNDDEIVHGRRQRPLKALSDYVSDDSDTMSPGTSRHKRNIQDSSSDDSLVAEPRKRFKKNPVIVTSENSDTDESSGNVTSQQFALNALSDYETGESNGKSASVSPSNERFRRLQSTPSKCHVESDSDSGSDIAHSSLGIQRKKPFVIETGSSDSDSQNSSMHISKKIKTNSFSPKSNLGQSHFLNKSNTTNLITSSRESSLPSTSAFTGTSFMENKSSEDSDDASVTNHRQENSNIAGINRPSSSNESSEDSLEELPNQRVTRSSLSKVMKCNSSPSSESSDNTDSSRFSRLRSSRNSSTITANESTTSREDIPASTAEFPRRITRGQNRTNIHVTNLSRGDVSRENRSGSRTFSTSLFSVNIQPLNNPGNTSRVTLSYRLPPRENRFTYQSNRLQTRQRTVRERNSVSTGHDESSNESDIRPGTSRFVRRRFNYSSSSSDSENATANTGRNVLENDVSDQSSDSDIQPPTQRHGQRRVITSDHSSSDSEDTIVPSTRRNGTRMKIEDSDDNKEEEKPGSKGANVSSDSDNESEKCPICFDKFRLQEVGNPESCDHSFCASCIQEWAKNNNTCPVDRKIFNSITIRTHLQGRIDRQVPIETPTRNPFEELFNVLTVLSDVGVVSSFEIGNFVDSEDDVLNSDSEGPDDVCCVCYERDDNGDIIACDLCNHVYHLSCLAPPLYHIPVGDWFCPPCSSVRLFPGPLPSTSSSESD